ncbi:hypothetical protein ASPACDRAFT_62762 [Aspergillus aculeatus ATCC 16872]|uniref:Zn(2)-C6 fungal-type domain-containing protein n=1 Tax=Aspergillus aculeatus (strain ATCC 16872 / CBS 172.66 / WB 5094) TaxID=690307 RepID=A0A1L9WLJ8_ASPA1|nr:uncharacterized protein ASPACDRAFT_62762 [Aspergillus aculeatus ATCC 16872]OJJ97045.1 hypothetical protein ASPACDRAFT_62762 [Aspergillus aculeatus ATCC 16872]
MSLRRRSCNACFKGRRKCDLEYPVCENCRRTNKTCQYAYPPRPPPGRTDDPPTVPDEILVSPTTRTTSNSTDLELDLLKSPAFTILDPTEQDAVLQLPLSFTPGRPCTPDFTPPETISFSATSRFVGTLGEVQPIQGSTRSWQWVMDELKAYPRELARRGETIFIHRDLYHDEMPRPIRMAFGVCSSFCLSPETTNREMAFRVIDAEVSELLQPPTEPSLSSSSKLLRIELARLQALLLYQTLRLFHGNLQQRVAAEQQGSMLMTAALKMIVRAQSEPELQSPRTRHAWVLGECIRRTALLLYFLYGVNSVYREGICVGLHTLRQLPLSAKMSSWGEDDQRAVQEDQGHLCDNAETLPYEAFLARWLVSMPRRLDRFEKLLIVPCQGLEAAEAFEGLGGLVV